MNEFPCPDCAEGIGSRVHREHTDAGVKILFECGDCEHSWEVTF
ncbi:hypothetical protein [Halostella litorea]|nr:hypothetical protein [Halostella litorea]